MKRRFSGVKTFLTNYRYFWDTFLRQNSCITEGQRRIHDIRKEAGEKFRHYTFQTYYGHIHNHQNPEEFRKNYATLVIVKRDIVKHQLGDQNQTSLDSPSFLYANGRLHLSDRLCTRGKKYRDRTRPVQNCTAMQSSMQCVAHTMPVCNMALHLRWW